VVALLLGVEGVDGAAAGGHEAARVPADVRAVGGDGVDQLEADRVDRGVARDRLILVLAVRVEQVLERDF
jgi:hypothetical protein